MSYHEDNINVYQEIKDNLSVLVPFVGAGLSAFAYPMWKNVLKELACKITDTKNNRAVNKLIKADQLEEAAQKLEEFRSKANMARDLANVFTPKKLNSCTDLMSKQAVNLLPLLFPRLVVTTNFDQTLETAYQLQGKPFASVIHPGHTELLNQLLLQPNNTSVCGLYKFHGTIAGPFIEYDNLIFTQRQYDQWYNRSSKLVADLRRCFQKRKMLFLGCSLNQDRTMNILDTIIKQEPGIFHYTIIDCQKKDRDNKIRFLGEKHVRAIVYKAGQHEAVRIILEHLLEEIFPDRYQALPFYAGALEMVTPLSLFAPDAGLIPLSGRQEEINQLLNFCTVDPSIPFCWWAITGPGGSGKSRLVIELQKKLGTDWNTYFIKRKDIKMLTHFSLKFTEKTLLIADNVQAYARELGQWMEELCSLHRSLPLRILIVERDSSEKTWTKLLYDKVWKKQMLQEKCFRRYLKLKPLQKNDLLDIMKNYKYARQKFLTGEVNIITDLQIKSLYDKLEAIDPELRRPIYALLLMETIKEEEQEDWNKIDILNDIVNNEFDRMQYNLDHIIGSDKIPDKKLSSACLYLQCAATVWKDADIKTIKNIFKSTWNIIEEKAERFSQPEDLLSQAGIINGSILPAIRPDLIGEYYVYTWLLKQSKEVIRQFLTCVLSNSNSKFFFEDLYADYYFLFDSNQWRKFLPLIQLPSETLYLDYMKIISVAEHYISQEMAVDDVIHMYSMDNPRIGHPHIYLSSSLHIDYKKNEPLHIIYDWIACLIEEIYHKYPLNRNIKNYYVNFLFNIIYYLSNDKFIETIDNIRKIAETTKDYESYRGLLLRSLTYFFTKTAYIGLYYQYIEIENINKYYIDSDIENDFIIEIYDELIYSQKVDQYAESVILLKKIINKYDFVTDWFSLSHGLSNLDEINQAFKMLKRINKIEKENLDYWLYLVNGLCDFGYEDQIDNSIKLLNGKSEGTVGAKKEWADLEEWRQNMNYKKELNEDNVTPVKILNKVIESVDDKDDCLLYLAKGLSNLISKQSLEKATESVNMLKKLLMIRGKENYCILLIKGISNLVREQELSDATKSVNLLKKIADQYIDDFDYYWFFLAKSLAELVYKQELVEATKSVDLLKKIAKFYNSDESLWFFLAKGLSDLVSKQKIDQATKTISCLEDSVKHCNKYPLAYIFLAKGYSCLAEMQDKDQAVNTVTRLENLAKVRGEYPLEYIKIYSSHLHASTFENKAPKIISIYYSSCFRHKLLTKCIPYLSNFNYHTLSSIWYFLAQALLKLMEKQNEHEATETYKRFKKIVNEHNKQFWIMIAKSGLDIDDYR